MQNLGRWAPWAFGLAVLAACSGVTALLLIFKEAPVQAAAPTVEKPLRVEAMAVVPEEVPVTIRGYGSVRSLRTVSIASEVGGRVVSKHPSLHAGGIVVEGEVLFSLDTIPFQLAVDEARAFAAQQAAGIAGIETEGTHERARLESLDRASALAKGQFDRAQGLLREGIGSQSEVDDAERAYVAAREQSAAVTRTLELIPLRIEEMRGALGSAEARVARAELDLERAVVRAPFTARVKSAEVETGQLVSVGQELLALADDSQLEVLVPLDTREARRWLGFNGERPLGDGAWFTALKQVPCTVRWTEAPETHAWSGTLQRVESFDELSRTLTVAVRVEGADAAANAQGAFPLVDGMFCTVELRGETLNNVYRLPPSAVSYENKVYLAIENRLKTAEVTVARTDNDFVYVSGGLEPGVIVVTTRLVAPLDNSLLDLIMEAPASKRPGD